MRVRLWAAWTGAAAVFTLPWLAPAQAQQASSHSRPARNAHTAADSGLASAGPVGLPPDAFRRLRSDDGAQIKTALEDVRVAGRSGTAAVSAICERLQRGLPESLTEAALETLGDTESEAATDTIAWYVHHRSVTVRRAAVEALGKTRGGAAPRALRAALADDDATVRATSATALGSMKVRDAVQDLFAALDHHVPEAAASIGAVCATDDCERLSRKIGVLPFDVVTSGLDEVLSRPSTEIADDAKLKIVTRLRELGTAEAHRFLKNVQGRWPARASRRVKQAIDQAVLATAASPGSDGSEVAP